MASPANWPWTCAAAAETAWEVSRDLGYFSSERASRLKKLPRFQRRVRLWFGMGDPAGGEVMVRTVSYLNM